MNECSKKGDPSFSISKKNGLPLPSHPNRRQRRGRDRDVFLCPFRKKASQRKQNSPKCLWRKPRAGVGYPTMARKKHRELECMKKQLGQTGRMSPVHISGFKTG